MDGLDKLGIGKLKSLAREHVVSLDGCLEKSEIVAKLRAAGVDDAAASGGPSAKRPCVEPSAAPQPTLKKRCEACEKEPADFAVVECMQCKAFFCAACDTTNHASKLLKSHIRKPILESVAPTSASPSFAASAPAPKKPKVQQTGGFFDLSVPQLKILSKMRSVKIEGCTEKEDIVAALKAANVPESAMKMFPGSTAAKADAAVAAANSAVTAQAAVKAAAEKAAWRMASEPPQPKKVAPPKPQRPLTREEMWEKMEEQKRLKEERAAEMYSKYRSLFSIGAMFDLLTNVCLWKNEIGNDRIFFLNALAPNGWANTIEVVQHGERRMKVRSMVYDIKTNTMKMNAQQIGWVDITAIVDDFTGDVLLKPHDLSYQNKKRHVPNPKTVLPGNGQNQIGVTTNRWNRSKADGSGETAEVAPSHTGKQVDADAEDY